MRRVLPAVVLLAGSLALAACAPDQPAATPTPTATPATESPVPTSEAPDPSPTPTPQTPTPTPTIQVTPGGLPADCESAYSPAMRERLEAFGALNTGRQYAWSSKVADLLDVIQGAPNLTCDWYPGGDAFLTQNAALIPEMRDQLVRDALTRDFSGCDATGESVDCQRELERQQGFPEYERVLLRGHLLFTTYAANADKTLVDDAIADMLAFLP